MFDIAFGDIAVRKRAAQSGAGRIVTSVPAPKRLSAQCSKLPRAGRDWRPLRWHSHRRLALPAKHCRRGALLRTPSPVHSPITWLEDEVAGGSKQQTLVQATARLT